MSTLKSIAGLSLTAVCVAGLYALPAVAADTPSVAAFRVVQSVLNHPRCMNCHTLSAWPTQGDDQHRHTFNVLRGPDDRGATGMKCTTCHQDKNIAAGNVPGVKDWRMAAIGMGWTGLSPSALCKVLLDPAKNGGRSGANVVEHMRSDERVLWAWAPGGKRSVPSVSHDQMIVAAEKWIKLGAECPGS
ncbi:MAG: hypothetical protein ABL973_00620 [Micropepsaceae bacterium]